MKIQLHQIPLKFPQYKGTLTAITFCVLSILSVVVPIIQIISLVISYLVLFLVQKLLSKQHFADKCYVEVICTFFVFIILSLITSILFFQGQFKNKTAFSFKYLFLFLLFQFCILQTPFLIIVVGSYYNCSSDGQTILALFYSSPLLSLTLILWGIIYDIVDKYKNKEK